jgi:hypothetical protein
MPKIKGMKKKKSKSGSKSSSKKSKGSNTETKPSMKNGGQAISYNDTTPSSSRGIKKPVSAFAKKAHMTTVCSVTNPFCSGAKAAGLPDGKNANTLRMQIRCHVPVTAGKQVLDNSTAITGVTTGNFVYINPSLVYAIYGANALATGNYTLTYGAALPGNAIITTAANKITNYRVVSAGVIIRNTSNVTNSSGYLLLGVHHCDANVAGATVASGTMNYAEVQTVPLYAGMEHCWVSKPCGSSFAEFIDIPAGGSTAFNPHWTSLAIEMVGGVANTTAIDLELFFNVEVQMGGDGALQPFACRAIPHNPVALQAQTRVHAGMGSFIEGGVAKAEAWVSKHAMGAVEDVLSSVGSWMGLL